VKAHKLLLHVDQAAELVRLLPAGIEAAKKAGETILVITVKVPEVGPSPEEVKAFAAGVPRDHVTGKMG